MEVESLVSKVEEKADKFSNLAQPEKVDLSEYIKTTDVEGKIKELKLN